MEFCPTAAEAVLDIGLELSRQLLRLLAAIVGFIEAFFHHAADAWVSVPNVVRGDRASMEAQASSTISARL